MGPMTSHLRKVLWLIVDYACNTLAFKLTQILCVPRAGAVGLWLADPDGLCRAAQPGHPAACGGSRVSCQHALQGGGRLAAAARLVPDVPQLLFATWQRTPALATA